MKEKLAERFLELEEQQFLLKKRIFELLKLAGDIENKMEQIAAAIYEDE